MFPSVGRMTWVGMGLLLYVLSSGVQADVSVFFERHTSTSSVIFSSGAPMRFSTFAPLPDYFGAWNAPVVSTRPTSPFTDGYCGKPSRIIVVPAGSQVIIVPPPSTYPFVSQYGSTVHSFPRAGVTRPFPRRYYGGSTFRWTGGFNPGSTTFSWRQGWSLTGR